jgi:hypothetical protein
MHLFIRLMLMVGIPRGNNLSSIFAWQAAASALLDFCCTLCGQKTNLTKT